MVGYTEGRALDQEADIPKYITNYNTNQPEALGQLILSLLSKTKWLTYMFPYALPVVIFHNCVIIIIFLKKFCLELHLNEFLLLGLNSWARAKMC